MPLPVSSLVSPALMPRWGWATLVVLVVGGTSISVGAWRYALNTEQESNRIRFERRVDDMVGDVQQRLDDAARLLRAAASLFGTAREVGLSDWKAFADGQNLEEAFPGLVGVGYAAMMRPEWLPRLQTSMQLEGVSDFRVFPTGDRPVYAPVLFREPESARNRALGFDQLSDPLRREALERARDTARPAMSAGVPLIQDGGAQGTLAALLVHPVYQVSMPVDTLEQRRDAIKGWVYTPIRFKSLLGDLVQRRADDMKVTLTDGAAQLFSAHADAAAGIPRFHPSQSAERHIVFAGRDWTLGLQALPTFDAAQPSSRAQLILAGGLAMTLLVATVVGALLNMRGRALALAEHLSAAYRGSEERVRTVLENAAEGIVTLSPEGRLLTANPAARQLLELPAAVDGPGEGQSTELAGLKILDRLPLDLAELRRHFDAPSEGPRREWRAEALVHPASGGAPRTLLLSASEVRPEDGSRCFVLMLSDVTELKQARARADEAAALNATILANAPFCVLTTDRAGRILSVNPAAERLLGYAAGELLGRVAAEALHLPHEMAMLAARLSAETGETVAPTGALAFRALRGQPGEVECSFVRKDGSTLPVMIAVTPLIDGLGRHGGFLGIAYDITERKRSEAYIRHMAHHDELTGLPNRTLLQETARHAIESAKPGGGQLAVLLLDLDRFKQINDSLGHQAGDVVLCAVAARLKHCLRTSDTVARMGGDEFVILLPQIDSAAQAERVASKVLEAMVEPIQSGPHRLAVTPSIGIAVYPADGEDLPTLLRNADVAMYQCKANGRNGYTAYTAQMHTASARRLALEGDLRLARQRGELSLHYQPLVRLADREIVGVEALLRWTHPQRGPIPPADFIPIAEDTGLIVGIGEWVLRTACRDMRELEQRSGRRLKLAVNLSPRQLRAEDLTATIADALERSGWRAQDLELEITESMVIDNPDSSIAAMQRLRGMGVGMAIDDFGTGYSSLSYLTRFPVAKLKLDRSFVSGLPHSEQDAAIATSVVAMGHGLKLQVLAEGIETEEQADFLRNLGCEMGQGWLFARPMPLDDLAARLHPAPALAT